MSAAAEQASPSTTLAAPAKSQSSTAQSVVASSWDPFALMDRLDAEAITAELEGAIADELVYVIKDGGKEQTALSKAGIDEACRILATTEHNVIREESIKFERSGAGEQEEAFFTVMAARYVVSPDGREVKMDTAIGAKRQPLYFEALPLTLDSLVPGKKWKGRTYRELLDLTDGRSYLQWVSENFREESVRAFCVAILNGEVADVVQGRKLNPHWYEHGAMKAARNARSRLLPIKLKADVIATAKAIGKVREIKREREDAKASAAPASNASAPVESEKGPSDAQIKLYRSLLASHHLNADEKSMGERLLTPDVTREFISKQIDALQNLIAHRAKREREQKIEALGDAAFDDTRDTTETQN